MWVHPAGWRASLASSDGGAELKIRCVASWDDGLGTRASTSVASGASVFAATGLGPGDGVGGLLATAVA